MKCRLPVTLIFLLFVFTAVSQHTDPTGIVPEKRKARIESMMEELKKFNPEPVPGRVQIERKELPDYFKLSVRINKKGVIALPGKNWIYILTTSAHDDPETGDISLAIDQNHRIFQNEGHVCGGIIHFETGRIRKIKNSRQFFKYFTSDTDGEGWRRIR